jgi:FemAB-related protein (PEP-CTERM system-associated)
MGSLLSATETETGLIICSLDDRRREEWDLFVRNYGTFFHLSAWRRVFETAFGFKTHYLLAERNGRIEGVLPLVEQKSILFGHGLIAAPFCMEGGPIGGTQACRSLDEAAARLMEKTGASFVEFRSRSAIRRGWQAKKDLYATFRRDITPDDESNLKAIPRKQRAVLRKAMTAGLTVQVHDRPDILHAIYARSVHRLGTPVFPLRYFRQLCEAFGESAEIVIIYEGDEPVSGVLSFYFDRTVLPLYGGGLPRARQNGANDLMYWEVMRRAARRGCTVFDFGRSKKGTGAFDFKKNWGFEPEGLEYEYLLAGGATMPDSNAASPRYARMVAIWKQLPAWVVDRVGPRLTRHFN